MANLTRVSENYYPGRVAKTAGTPATPRRKAAKSGDAGLRGGAPAQERELRAQGRKTMRKLLDAGMVVFEKRGYHAARVDDIVKVAKTSHGTFYLYFANKEDLFRALAVDVADAMVKLADDLGEITPDDAGYAAIRDWLGQFTDLYFHYGPVIRAWTEAELSGNDLANLGTDVLRSFGRGLAARIEKTAPPDIDPQIASLAFLAMVERFNYLVLSGQARFEREAMLDTLAAITHAGLFGGQHTRRSVAIAR